ncbi:MAG: hypothetical protein ABFR95_03200 [Actinomycetota bacterium]
MATYRKDAAREHWHIPWPVRILIAIVGLGMLLLGFVGWALENEYGGDTDRAEYVIGHDVETGLATVQEGERGEVVYEFSSMQDAEAWVQSQRGPRDYTVPVMLLIGGALMIIVGIAPAPSKREAGSIPATGLETPA